MRPGGRWGSRSTVVGASVAAATITALTVGGIALADNGAESGTGADDSPTAQATPEVRVHDREFVRRGPGPGIGMGGRALHGEFVVRKADGGYETVAVQQGAVQSVSTSAVTVKSDDGYTKTYAVDEDTLVNAARDGIGSIEKDDKVSVAAVVSGDTATAVRVVDVSQRKAAFEKFRPGRPGGDHGDEPGMPGDAPDVPGGEPGAEGNGADGGR